MRYPVRFVLRKLHSLSGVVPVGVFLAVHLWTNATALGGQAGYDRAVAEIQALPGLALIELFGIALPIAYHAVFGVILTLSSRPNVVRYPYSGNWMYVMQRATGVLALAFIALHVWEYRGAKLVGTMGVESFYPALAANLSSTQLGFPWTAAGYVLGIGACALHFSTGLWGFCFSWGLLGSARARRTAATVFAVVGLAVFSAGAATTFHFATGVGAQPPCDVLDSSSRAPRAR